MDEVLGQHRFYDDAGPLWHGMLWDAGLAQKMHLNNPFPGCNRLLATIAQESRIDTVGFYDVHWLAKKLRLGVLPKKHRILEALRKKGYKASETHFSNTALRTDANEKVFTEILKQNA